MPMPREEEDDLFHDVDDVEFADDDSDSAADEAEEKPKKKTAKKKTAVKKKPVKKKTAKKKATKKAPAVEEAGDAVTEDSEEAAEEKPKKPARRKRRKKVVKGGEEKKGFGDGLFDESEDSTKPAKTASKAKAEKTSDEATEPPEGDDESAEKGDEYGRPEPVANYVVHVYELGRLKRTIEKDFTPEAAEAFATEFNRTSKKSGRTAVAGKKDTQPAKEVAEP